MKNEDFSFSTELIPRPFKWAQWIAGIDILSERLTGTTGRAEPTAAEGDATDDIAHKFRASIGADAMRTFREGRSVQIIKALYSSCKSHKSL